MEVVSYSTVEHLIHSVHYVMEPLGVVKCYHTSPIRGQMSHSPEWTLIICFDACLVYLKTLKKFLNDSMENLSYGSFYEILLKILPIIT